MDKQFFFHYKIRCYDFICVKFMKSQLKEYETVYNFLSLLFKNILSYIEIK